MHVSRLSLKKGLTLLTLAAASSLILWSCQSRAGLWEITGSANYKKTNFDANDSTASETFTGSLGYYFWDLSALELSYSAGDANQIQPQYTAYQSTTAYGLDIMFLMANKDSSLKPYLKVGAAYLIKSMQYIAPPAPTAETTQQGIAPVAGLGFKWMIGQQFGLHAGVDVDTSPLNYDPVTYDFGAEGGFNVLF